MQVRLTDRDMKRVNLAQKYFSRMQPVPIQMGSADVVRVALSQLLPEARPGRHRDFECSFRTRKGGRTAAHEAGSSEAQRIDALSSRPRLTRSHVETGVREGFDENHWITRLGSTLDEVASDSTVFSVGSVTGPALQIYSDTAHRRAYAAPRRACPFRSGSRERVSRRRTCDPMRNR